MDALGLNPEVDGGKGQLLDPCNIHQLSDTNRARASQSEAGPTKVDVRTKGKGVLNPTNRDGHVGSSSAPSSSKGPLNSISTHESSWVWKPKLPGPEGQVLELDSNANMGMLQTGPDLQPKVVSFVQNFPSLVHEEYGSSGTKQNADSEGSNAYIDVVGDSGKYESGGLLAVIVKDGIVVRSYCRLIDEFFEGSWTTAPLKNNDKRSYSDSVAPVACGSGDAMGTHDENPKSLEGESVEFSLSNACC